MGIFTTLSYFSGKYSPNRVCRLANNLDFALLYNHRDFPQTIRGSFSRLMNPKAMATLCASSAFIALNWFVYVWAVQSGEIYAASLGITSIHC